MNVIPYLVWHTKSGEDFVYNLSACVAYSIWPGHDHLIFDFWGTFASVRQYTYWHYSPPAIDVVTMPLSTETHSTLYHDVILVEYYLGAHHVDRIRAVWILWF